MPSMCLFTTLHCIFKVIIIFCYVSSLNLWFCAVNALLNSMCGNMVLTIKKTLACSNSVWQHGFIIQTDWLAHLHAFRRCHDEDDQRVANDGRNWDQAVEGREKQENTWNERKKETIQLLMKIATQQNFICLLPTGEN